MVPNTLSTMLFEAWRVNVVFYFQKSLAPSLPEDLAISFYIQSHKLIFAVYQLSNVHGTMKFDSHQAECSIPWLNEVLVLFTVALQLCQQLKDKVIYCCNLHISCSLKFVLWHKVSVKSYQSEFSTVLSVCYRCLGGLHWALVLHKSGESLNQLNSSHFLRRDLHHGVFGINGYCRKVFDTVI